MEKYLQLSHVAIHRSFTKGTSQSPFSFACSHQGATSSHLFVISKIRKHFQCLIFVFWNNGGYKTFLRCLTIIIFYGSSRFLPEVLASEPTVVVAKRTTTKGIIQSILMVNECRCLYTTRIFGIMYNLLSVKLFRKDKEIVTRRVRGKLSYKLHYDSRLIIRYN